MATTAWKLPGTAVGAGWTTPDGIKALGGDFASKSVGPGGYSGVLRGQNFGFTTADIPAGSTIDGIEAEAVLLAGGNGYPASYSLYVQKTAGTNVGSNKAASWNYPFDASQVTRVAGGAADTWSAGVTAADAVSSSFAVACEFRNEGDKFTAVGYVGSMRLRFHYTPPASPPTVTANSASALAGAGGTVQMAATNSPTSWSLPGSPPTGVSINSSGLVTWTSATPAGVHSITVRATNAGGSGDGTLTLTITAAASGHTRRTLLGVG
jgi:hypothetical protein